jgi:hypothetical protein
MAVVKSYCGCGEHRDYRLDVDCDDWSVVDENEAVESKTVENNKPALEMTEIY